MRVFHSLAPHLSRNVLLRGNGVKPALLLFVLLVGKIPDMNIQTEMARIERLVAKNGMSLRQFLLGAGVNGTQWSRWKNTGATPLVTTWAKVEKAAAKLRKNGRGRT